MKKVIWPACDPLKQGWCLLFYILAIELALAFSMPENLLTQLPLLQSLINGLEYVFPILGKITEETANRPEAVRLYIYHYCIATV